MGAFTPIKIVFNLLFFAFICYGGWLTYSYKYAPEQELAAADASARVGALMAESGVTDEERERMQMTVDNAFEDSMNPEVSFDHRRDLNDATDEDYSDFGEPTMTAE